LKSDGTLWAWGLNSAGQLGDGTTTDRLAPVLVGAGYRSASASGERWCRRPGECYDTSYSLAVKTDGTLWAWGDDRYGALVPTAPRASPVLLDAGYVSISAGPSHFVGVKVDGTLWTCGDNMYGQLGDGTHGASPSPKQVGAGFAHASAGGTQTFAVRSDGSLWGWGTGLLGDGAQPALAPMRVP
jgi:alpha-tubulin suppressor-like RCC1 family protein